MRLGHKELLKGALLAGAVALAVGLWLDWRSGLGVLLGASLIGGGFALSYRQVSVVSDGVGRAALLWLIKLPLVAVFVFVLLERRVVAPLGVIAGLLFGLVLVAALGRDGTASTALEGR